MITARIGGQDVAARIGAPGRHMVQNALAVLGAAHLVGADIGKVALGAGQSLGRARPRQAPCAAPSERARSR